MQEIAFTLADAITYIEETIKRGLEVDDFVPQFVFHLSANLDVFEEASEVSSLKKDLGQVDEGEVWGKRSSVAEGEA